jgi:hypothetical protein
VLRCEANGEGCDAILSPLRLERRSAARRWSMWAVDMGAFLFIAGVTAVAGGSLAALYYLVGPPSEARRNKSDQHPAKKHLLSHWR